MFCVELPSVACKYAVKNQFVIPNNPLLGTLFLDGKLFNFHESTTEFVVKVRCHPPCMLTKNINMDSLFDTLWSDSAFAAIDNGVEFGTFITGLFEEPFGSLTDPMETSPARTSPPATAMFDNLVEEDFFDPVEASWASITSEPSIVESDASLPILEEQSQPVHNTRSKRIKLATSEIKEEDDDSDYVYEYKRKTPAKRKSTASKPASPKSPPAKRSPKKPRAAKEAPANADSNEQTSCCLEGCNNMVTNRLRFSLRGQSTFKQDFLDMGWNKICPYHYFQNLYKAKKMNGK
jgi:hypothetical protein